MFRSSQTYLIKIRVTGQAPPPRRIQLFHSDRPRFRRARRRRTAGLGWVAARKHPRWEHRMLHRHAP